MHSIYMNMLSNQNEEGPFASGESVEAKWRMSLAPKSRSRKEGQFATYISYGFDLVCASRLS